MVKPYWSWSLEEQAPEEVPGEDGGSYVLTELAGKQVYLFTPAEPSPVAVVEDAAPEPPSWAWMRSSVGSQRFWRGRLT